MNKLTDFWQGVIAGFIATAIIFSFVIWIVISNYKNKESVKYAKELQAVEQLREDYINRNPDEFLEIPDVRRAADGAAAEFERKRDEALQRFRSKYAD